MREAIRARRMELFVALVAFAVFAAFSGRMLLRQSPAPQFIYQAAGWLSGSLSIPEEPPNLNDWVKIGDRWFSSFPPFPAVLMLPFVAIHGVAFNDVFFTVCVAAITLGLFAGLLRGLRTAGDSPRSDAEIAVLAGFFAFGTVFFPSAIRGEVWFTAHVVGAALTFVYIGAATRLRSPWLAGLAFGCAVTTRASLLYSGLFFVIEVVAPDGKVPGPRDVVKRIVDARGAIVRFAIPSALVLGAALWMNHARFGDFTEFGHRLMYDNRVNSRIQEHGLFSVHYLADNVRAAFLLLPTVSTSPLKLGFDGHGMSMLVTTPLLGMLFFSRRSRLTLALAATALVVALPGLLYMNDGWFQFGYRFSNDFLPYLFVLLAVGGRAMDRRFVGLGMLGVVVCGWGAVVFNRFG